jgi:hypothetical protein
MPFPAILDCLVAFVSIYLVLVIRDRRRRGGLPYPPGPRSWPIFGNFLDVPSRRPWVAYVEMSKKYGTGHISSDRQDVKGEYVSSGDVMYFRLFGQDIVVLSSLSAIKDLLERHGEWYSDRPSFPLHGM